MRQQRTDMGGQSFQSMTAASRQWLTAAVALAAAGAIAISFFLTLAMPMPAPQDVLGATRPAANESLKASSTAQVQAMPDGMMDGVLSYLKAHGVEVSMR